ncbi:MAG: HEAT repeat domain-containing protein [Acidobacteria bacterium]|nr:HEAT repeat domain-containing protein [Acidobacteriota bacterium]
MRKISSPVSFLVLFILLTTSACAGGRGAGAATTAAAAATTATGSASIDQDKGVTPASFIQVEGADLSAKLAAAAQRARADNRQTPYWTAYSFDVRPGVAVDPASGGTFHGSMNGYGGIYVFSGTTASGMTVETRNLGVFLLRSPGSNAITRMEIYNLDRKREYSGYPVYFTGRAGNEESLNFLRGLAEGPPAPSAGRDGVLNERAALALALHDDPRVAGVLKDFVRTSKNKRVRSASVFWLGQIGGETAFLADIVRNTNEELELRRQAAHSVGEGRDRAALATLQTLYASATERELRKSIVHASAGNEDREGALAFLLRAAKTDADREVRKAAVHALGEYGGDRAVDELMRIYAAEQDTAVKRTVMHALAEIETPRAEAKLFEIARSPSEPQESRKVAIHHLGEKGTDASTAELVRIYDADQNREVRRTIIHSLSENKSQRAEDKLFEIARGSDDPEMRKTAIHVIGERAGKRSLELLRDTVEGAGGDAQIQIQALRAISERPAEESVPLLIKAAKSHPNPQVRRAAIRWLGESGDPRALEYFRQVLTEKPDENKEQ